MNIISKRTAKILSVVFSLISLFALAGPPTYAPADADNLRLSFTAIADTHIDNVFNGTRVPLLAEGLEDMSKAQVKNDALLIAGDLTEGGLQWEYYKLAYALQTRCGADNILPVSGNHDIWGPRLQNGTRLMNYEYNADKYFDFLRNTAGIDTATIYFSREIKGYLFVILNSERLEDDTYLSPAQIGWLDSLLASRAGGGKPVFVSCHHPLASIGDEADDLYAVMKKYDGRLDIFFLTGHYHTPFGSGSIVTDGSVTFVALPCYGKGTASGPGKTGTGYCVEAYDGEVLFRARDFTGGRWLPEYDRAVALTAAG